jgi:hypothetical protein
MKDIKGNTGCRTSCSGRCHTFPAMRAAPPALRQLLAAPPDLAPAAAASVSLHQRMFCTLHAPTAADEARPLTLGPHSLSGPTFSTRRSVGALASTKPRSSISSRAIGVRKFHRRVAASPACAGSDMQVSAAPAKALSVQRAPGCMSRPGNSRAKPAPSLAKVAHTLMVRTPCGCSLVARPHATSVRAALL